MKTINKDLKKAIVNHILENENEFQIVNNTIDKFRAYIYDSKGEYLIGGKDVTNFIQQSSKLLTN